MSTTVSVVEFGGVMTPDQALFDALDLAADCKEVVIVLQQKNGDIRIGYSSGSHVQKIGLLEIAKHDLIKGAEGG